jgi:hypothetical protein
MGEATKRIKEIAKERGLSSKQTGVLTHLFKKRFPTDYAALNKGKQYPESYVDEWAERISGGDPLSYADSKTKKVLKEVL